MQTITRSGRQARPALEGLEGRRLLSSGQVSAQAAPTALRQFNYTTPQGAHVTIQLFGLGNLDGTTVDSEGDLNLVYNGTNQATAIIGHVSGGTGHASLLNLYNAAISPMNLSGIGASPLAQVHLKDFDLINGGEINLTGGVQTLILNSAGSNSQIHLRDLPTELSPTQSGGLSATNNGVTLQYSLGSTGALTLSSVSGQFTAGLNLVTTSNSSTSSSSGTTTGSTTTGSSTTIVPSSHAAPPAPPGIVLSINDIAGVRNVTGLGDPEVFGYDPTANTLIRFDATTGAELQTISLAGMPTPIAGVALGRDHGQLVVLVGSGTTIQAFNAVSGDPVGQFSTTNLAPLGFTAIDGIGSTDDQTVITDSSAGPNGMAQIIDVSASLDQKQAVTVGSPFAPQREFSLSSGLTGVAGSNTIYATGAAFFDPFQPNRTEAGVLSLNTAGGQLKETARTELSGGSGPAFGSIDQMLALVTGVSNGQNVVTLLSPQDLSSKGTITLNDPNQLAGLSESFRPDLAGSVLVDIQGNVQSVRAHDATGLVLNDAGNLNLVKIEHASNSVMVGEPFGHVQLPIRSNVTILSTPRIFARRGNVDIVKGLKELGPLSLP